VGGQEGLPEIILKYFRAVCASIPIAGPLELYRVLTVWLLPSFGLVGAQTCPPTYCSKTHVMFECGVVLSMRAVKCGLQPSIGHVLATTSRSGM
jgi:hypothetical protein